MGARITIQLNDALAQKIKRVQAATRKSVTAIVNESIERYCDEVRASGFLGSGEGPSDLSTNYKSLLRPGSKGA